MKKILVTSLLIAEILSLLSFEDLNKFYHSICSELDYETKEKLIEEKQKVVKNGYRKYKYKEGSRFKFLGKGGYSRVYLDMEN